VPGHLGVSACDLFAVAGLEQTVRGLDAIDGIPILDIKPYSAAFQPASPVREPAWMGELMREYC
jgi:tRNA (Thr-GGU) A37 N-methylase